MRTFIRTHLIGILFSILVGLICIAPQLVFIHSLGSEYKGIHMMYTDNENDYIARMQEIADGHWTLGSPPFFEYKSSPPMTPPTIFEFLFAGLSKVTHISISHIVVISKFFLPGILFFLLYYLVFQFLGKQDTFATKWTAIAAGLISVLGYDLLGSRTLQYISGQSLPQSFILWTRTTNPITGAIFLFGFLNVLYDVLGDNCLAIKKDILAGVLFGIMILSYFFSWGLAISIILFLVIGLYIQKNYMALKNIAIMLGSGAIVGIPYFYSAFLVHKNPYYIESVRRQLLFYSHHYVLSSLVIATAVLFFTLTIRSSNIRDQRWWLFSVTILLGALWAPNQQIITGIAIWPFHFIQYLKPLCYILLIVLSYYYARLWSPKLWRVMIGGIIVVSILFGILIQVGTYRAHYVEAKSLQNDRAVLDWFTEHAPHDCVILTNEGPDETVTRLLLIYTHCNDYISRNTQFLMPLDRIVFNYLVYMRLQGVTPASASEFVATHQDDISDIYGTLTSSPLGEEYRKYQESLRINERITEGYKVFYAKDFLQQLHTYRIDYVLTPEKLNNDLMKALHNPTLASRVAGFSIYSIK